MVGRGELTEEAWSVIAPLLPGSGQRSGQWRDHRTIIARSSTASCGSCGPQRPGVTCRCATARGRPVRIGSIAGGGMGPGIGFWRRCSGLTSKVHLACDGNGRPLSIVITPGQRHDSTQLAPLLDGIRVPRPSGRGRPRTRPDRLIADKGYSYPRCRRLMRQRQTPHTIPERWDQRARRATRPGRPLAFDQAVYARRNVVER